MNGITDALALLLTLLLCIGNVYSMTGHRVSGRKSFLWFVMVTVVCVVCNAYIMLFWGREVLTDIIIFTIAAPYFILFLLVSKDKGSQICFNFWLWVTIYAFLSNTAMLINDLTLQRIGFLQVLRILFLCAYFLLYHKVLLPYHRHILETPDVNWWFFSLIPLFFEILIVMTIKTAKVPTGFSRNYLMMQVVFVLMLLVYALIAYIFKKANAATKAEFEKAIYCRQLDAAKAQISFLNESQMQTAIHRHNMRHNLTTIDAFLATENVPEARAYIKEILGSIESLTLKHFCKNKLVNLLCSFFENKAGREGIQLTVDANLPGELEISDMELCVIVSNGLENAFHATAGLDRSHRWVKFYCVVRENKLLLEIKNPYVGEIVMQDQVPVAQQVGHGYGCRSIRVIVERHQGICLFEAKDGVFTLQAVIPLSV